MIQDPKRSFLLISACIKKDIQNKEKNDLHKSVNCITRKCVIYVSLNEALIEAILMQPRSQREKINVMRNNAIICDGLSVRYYIILVMKN